MPNATASYTQDAVRTRAENKIRAAGVTTVVAGVLFSIMALRLAQTGVGEVDIGSNVILGASFCVLGVLAMRMYVWSLWTTIGIAAALLVGQLWIAYGQGRTPDGRSLSVFLLVVPLMMLIMNSLAVGAARGLVGKTSRPLI